MKRKSLSFMIALVGVTSTMLAGCSGQAISSDIATSEVSVEIGIEASKEKTSDIASDNTTEGKSTEDADALNSAESTSSASEQSTEDEASTSVSVPEFDSAEEEEQWVLEQISGLWETNYKPPMLSVYEGKEVTYYSPNLDEDGRPESYTKDNDTSQVTSIEKKTENDHDYYMIKIRGFENKDLYWSPDQPDALDFPDSASGGFERPYDKSKSTLDAYTIVEQ